MPLYTDFVTMARDIVGYLRSTGQRELLPADDPSRGTLGYVTAQDPEVRWEISIIGLRVPENIRSLLQSQAGRYVLIDAWVNVADQSYVSDPNVIARLTDLAAMHGFHSGPVEVPEAPPPEVSSHTFNGTWEDDASPAEEETSRTVFDRLLEDE